jgi:hypothetical protein
LSDTSRKILGALTIFPGLLTATEELSSGLFYGRERKVFESISALWSESQPDTLDLAILAEMVGGDNPVTYVTNLLKPDELGCTEKPVFLAMVEEVVGKKKLLSDDVKLWIEYSIGEFTLTQIYSELGATSVSEKDAVRQAIHRMKDSGDVTTVGKGYGKYRRVDKTLEEVDLLGPPPEAVDIYLPLGVGDMVKIYPRSIIVCAGDSNFGKTALAHDFIKGNMTNLDTRLFFCEGGAEGLQDRLRKHEDKTIDEWRVKAYHRIDHFEDVIFPDALNVIDYLECPDEPWRIGVLIDAIYRKLNDGVVWINIQKGTGKELGRGGDWGRERAQLYLTLSRDEIIENPDPDIQYCVAKVLKAKAFIRTNPDNMVRNFSIQRGWSLWHYADWHYPKKVEPRKKFWS